MKHQAALIPMFIYMNSVRDCPDATSYTTTDPPLIFSKSVDSTPAPDFPSTIRQKIPAYKDCVKLGKSKEIEVSRLLFARRASPLSIWNFVPASICAISFCSTLSIS
jgi:hypothetical protein